MIPDQPDVAEFVVNDQLPSKTSTANLDVVISESQQLLALRTCLSNRCKAVEFSIDLGGDSSETFLASARRAARSSASRASVGLADFGQDSRAPQQDLGGGDGEAVGLVERDFGEMVEHCQRFFVLTGLVEVFGQIKADLVDGAVFFAELGPEPVSGHADVGDALSVPAAAELLAAEVAMFDQCAGVVGAVQLAHQFEDFLAGCQRAVTIADVFSDSPRVRPCAERAQVDDL